MRTVTLSAPGRNAISLDLMRSVRAELRSAGDEPILLTGEGDAFSAGLNLKQVQALDVPGMREFLGELDALVRDLFHYPGPSVALINGHAIAGGCVLALCCDHRVMVDSDRARIGLNEVAIGVRFPPQVIKLCEARLPRQHLERVTLGAGLHSPAQALELGLIDEVAADAHALAERRLAELAKHPRGSYSATKTLVRAGKLHVDPAVQRHFEAESLPVWTSDELKQTIARILGK